MPYRPSDKWYAAMTRLGSVSATAVLVIDQCPYVFASRPIRPKVAGGTTWNTNAKLLVGVLDVGGQTGTKVDPREGGFTLEDLTFNLTDLGGLVTQWISTEVAGTRIYGRTVTLYIGSDELAEDEFQPVWVGTLAEVSMVSAGGGYTFRAYSKLRLFDQDIMTGSNPSSGGSVRTGDNSAPYKVFTGNTDLIDEDDYYNTWKLKWTSGTNEGEEDTVFDYVGSSRTFTLTTGATAQIDKNDRFELYQFIEIVGNPINIWVRILTGNFALSGAIQTDYPLTSVTGSPTGLTFALADLDEDQIQAERDLWLSGVTFQMRWKDREKASDWMKEQVFAVLDGYPFLSPAGLVQFRMSRPQAPPAVPYDLRDENVVGVPDWTRAQDQMINEIWVWGDWNPATDEYQLLAQVTTLDTRYTPATLGITERLEIRSRGLNSAYSGVVLASAFAARKLARYGTGGPEVVKVGGGWDLGLLVSGERVLLTHASLPNLSAGTLGKSGESFEVTQQRMRHTAGKADVVLTSWYSGGIPMFIAPTTVASDYGSATPEDKQYGYIAASSGNFSDGRPPYTVI